MDILLDTTQAQVDLALGAGDLERESSLQTAVLLSLFTDARDEEAAPGSDPRGWWGNTAGDEWGSLLWTTWREVASQENAERARRFAHSSLQWMVRDGIASSVEVQSELQPGGSLILSVQLHRGDARQWQHLWESLDKTFEFKGGTLHLRAA